MLLKIYIKNFDTIISYAFVWISDHTQQLLFTLVDSLVSLDTNLTKSDVNFLLDLFMFVDNLTNEAKYKMFRIRKDARNSLDTPIEMKPCWRINTGYITFSFSHTTPPSFYVTPQFFSLFTFTFFTWDRSMISRVMFISFFFHYE